MEREIMIIKIQKSLNIGPPSVLIYDKEKTFVYEEPLSMQVMVLFKKDEAKIFHYAKIVDKKIKIGRRAPAQDW
jgi:hypothetical protein